MRARTDLGAAVSEPCCNVVVFSEERRILNLTYMAPLTQGAIMPQIRRLHRRYCRHRVAVESRFMFPCPLLIRRRPDSEHDLFIYLPADIFDPDRFIDQLCPHQRVNSSFFPFNAGPRTCLGVN